MAWVLVIIAVVAPWRSFQADAHWDRIRWVPFISPPVRTRDIIGNVLLYVPFGYFVSSLVPRSRRWPIGMASALLLSGATEVTQLFSSSRFPSLQDFLLNGLGAAAGVAVKHHTARKRQR